MILFALALLKCHVEEEAIHAPFTKMQNAMSYL